VKASCVRAVIYWFVHQRFEKYPG